MQEALGLPSVGDRERRPRRDAAARLQRHGAGTGAESPHRGGVLVRRSAAGAAGRAAALPGRCRRRNGDQGLRSALGPHRAARSSRTASRRFRRATPTTLRRAHGRHRGPDQRATAVHRLHEERAPRPPHRVACTATTSAFPPRGRAAPWRRSGPRCGLAPAQAEHEGRGYVQSDDVVNAGFIQGETSYVRVQVVYDELAAARRLRGRGHHATHPGAQPEEPVRAQRDAHHRRRQADRRPGPQLVRHPALHRRRARTGRHPVPLRQPRVAAAAQRRRRRPDRRRVDRRTRSLAASRALPDVHQLCELHRARGSPDLRADAVIAGRAARSHRGRRRTASRNGSRPRSRFEGPARELKYVLRAYDAKGNFDETTPAAAVAVYQDGAQDPASPAGQPRRTPRGRDAELLAGYGENDLAVDNIPLGSGTVKVQGSGIPAEHTVWVAGRQVPVDPQGNFVAEEILPTGTHTVEVAVLDDGGQRLAVPARPGVQAQRTCSTSASPTSRCPRTARAGRRSCCRARTLRSPTTRRWTAGWRST